MASPGGASSSGGAPSGAPPASLIPQGPPYAPPTAQLGGMPTVSLDVPICAVLLPCYLAFAAYNMTRFQLNRRRGHKFIPSAVIFGFCMSRSVAFVMRIVWACYPHNVSVAIAAGVFTNAGIIALFVVNLIFAQRIVRAFHPVFGWGRPFTYAFRVVYFCIFACFCMVVLALVWASFTLEHGLSNRLRIIRLVAITFIAVLAFLPVPIILVSILTPRSGPMDKFGKGRMRTKVRVLLVASTLLSIGAGFRCGVSYTSRPLTSPGWFNHKACFYCFDFAIELIVLSMFAIVSFDKRFHIPNGSSAPGHYSKGVPEKTADVPMSEEEPFGTVRPGTNDQQQAQARAWESRLENELETEKAV